MRLVKTFKNFEVWKYTPTFFKLFYIEFEPLTFSSRLRFIIDYIIGYHVYYLKTDDEYIGYCTVTNGKNPRFWFANENDIIIGPYFIECDYRGKGLGEIMVGIVLNECENNWENAYLFINNTNIPSIKLAKKNGAEFLFHVNNTRLKRLIKTELGEYGVYRIINT